MEVAKQFNEVLNKLNPIYKKTMTQDNVIEMARPKKFTENPSIKIYFARPYSSQERRTNENTNGLIRRYPPEGPDFNKISLTESQIIQ